MFCRYPPLFVFFCFFLKPKSLSIRRRRRGSHFVDFEAGETWEKVRDVGGLVDVQLIVEVMKQLLRGAREFASVGEGQVGGN